MPMFDDVNQPIVMKITLHAHGALSVEGPIHDKKFCLSLLDHARDAIKNHGKPTNLVTPEQPGLIIPAKDVQIGR